MKINTRVRLLTKVSLSKVWEWADSNPDDPLAEAYMAACEAIGRTDFGKIADRLERSWTGKEDGRFSAAFISYNFLYASRDAIGRVILDMLKREKRAR